MAQLELGLDDVRIRIPWQGRSPRDLTRIAQSIIFNAGAAGRHEFPEIDPGQLKLFPAAIREPRRYAGAPTLLP